MGDRSSPSGAAGEVGVNSATLETIGNSLGFPLESVFGASSVLSRIAISCSKFKKLSTPAEDLCLILETLPPSFEGPCIWFLIAL